MKLFYFFDFSHLKKHGTPVTYDTYINLEHGPIPSVIKNMVDSVDDDIDSAGLADTITVVRTEGSCMHRIKPLRAITSQELDMFSEIELEVLAQVCRRFGDKNTQFVEEASHGEVPWRETSYLETIPYTLASRDEDCQVSEEEIELAARLCTL